MQRQSQVGKAETGRKQADWETRRYTRPKLPSCRNYPTVCAVLEASDPRAALALFCHPVPSTELDLDPSTWGFAIFDGIEETHKRGVDVDVGKQNRKGEKKKNKRQLDMMSHIPRLKFTYHEYDINPYEFCLPCHCGGDHAILGEQLQAYLQCPC